MAPAPPPTKFGPPRSPAMFFYLYSGSSSNYSKIPPKGRLLRVRSPCWCAYPFANKGPYLCITRLPTELRNQWGPIARPLDAFTAWLSGCPATGHLRQWTAKRDRRAVSPVGSPLHRQALTSLELAWVRCLLACLPAGQPTQAKHRSSASLAHFPAVAVARSGRVIWTLIFGTNPPSNLPAAAFLPLAPKYSHAAQK
jgi:hypothetical protein